MLADIAIALFLVGFLMVGFFRGALRQLLALGAWLVAFVVAAQARNFIADYLLAQRPQFSIQYAQMLGLLIGFVVLFLAALAVIELSGRTVTLSSRPVVEELLGGGIMLFVGLLALCGVLIALGSYYAAPDGNVTADVDQVRHFYTLLGDSKIVGVLRDTLVPWIQFLLGPLLPPGVGHFG